VIWESARKSMSEFFWNLWPVWIVLVANLIIAIFISEFTFVGGAQALWKVLLRFLRLSLLLMLPLMLLPGLCSFIQIILNRRTYKLIQIETDRNRRIYPLKSWMLKPFQGIGLAMLISVKLLVLLQIYTNHSLTSSDILMPGQFSPERFISATVIGIGISLLLSLLWTLDDLGIRLYNSKSGEVKMVGKVVGFFLPVLFGFYGIFSLFHSHEHLLAIQYILQIVIILYPPFVVFNVLHTFYLRKQESILLARLKIQPRAILADGRVS
jgi:hypothetical protein